MNSISKKILPLAAWLTTASLACSAPVFLDDFSDNNRDGWFSSSTSSSNNVDASSGALVVNPGRSVQTHFTATTIALGETLTFSFDVLFSNPADQNGGFRFGLFDSNGSTIPTADGNIYTNYNGTIITTNPAAASGTPVVFRNREAGMGDALMTSTGGGLYTTVGNSGGSAGAFPAGVFLNASMSLTRTESGLDLFMEIKNGSTVLQTHSVTSTSPDTFTFDALGVSGVTGVNMFTLDNVMISYSASSIPEPSTYAALAGLGALALVGCRRRREV